jgi:hypothetical protein
MLRKAARLAILCIVLIAATTGAAAGRDTAPGWSRPGVVREVTRVPGRVWEWIARLAGIQPKCSMGIDPNGKPCPTPPAEVQPKCSGGIDPNGAPCVMPSAGCRCVP